MDLRTSKPRGPTDTEGALLLNGSTRVEFLTFFPGEGTLALSDSPVQTKVSSVSIRRRRELECRNHRKINDGDPV